MFFTVMYAAFAIIFFYNSYTLLEESVAAARDESSSNYDDTRTVTNSAPGYIGGSQFGVVGQDLYGGSGGIGLKPNELI